MLDVVMRVTYDGRDQMMACMLRWYEQEQQNSEIQITTIAFLIHGVRVT
jgi:ferritin